MLFEKFLQKLKKDKPTTKQTDTVLDTKVPITDPTIRIQEVTETVKDARERKKVERIRLYRQSTQ